MPSQTVDFLYAPAAALAGLYVSLVSNVDGVTKYSATTTSDTFGQWEINPKPPAGTYALYTGNAQGVLTTLVDPDFVVDPFQDDGTAVFPKQVTIAAGGLVVTAGGINVATGGITVAAGGAAITGNSTLAGSWTVTGSPNTFRNDGAGADEVLRVSASAGFNRMIDFQTAGTPRWRLYADAVAEGGANAGSNFALEARDDTGVSLGNAISVNRASRVVTVATGLVAAAGNINITVGALVFGAAASIVVPGATGLFVNNNANTQTNLAVLDAGPLQVRTSVDLLAAGQLQIGPTGGNASSIAMRGPQKALIVGNTGTSFGAGAQTLSAAVILGGEVEGVPTAAANYTFDTGANIDGAIANVATGDSFTFILANRSAGAFAITLVAAAGITIVGNTAIAQNKVATIYMRRVGAASWGAYVTVSA